MKKIGLFFGSFNPIHIGHLILANYILENDDLYEIWFIVSPQNPFKSNRNLLNEYNRLEMVDLALKNYPKMKANDIEFNLPRPSYTIDTLTHLSEKFPNYEFCLIMGEDILESLPKWKNYEILIKNHKLIVYPRIFSERKKNNEYLQNANINIVNAPIIELSATQIRNMIKKDKNIRPMLPPEVFEYLEGSDFYK